MEAIKEEVKQLIKCTYCDTEFDLEAEEGSTVYAGDESIDLCEACFEHMH